MMLEEAQRFVFELSAPQPPVEFGSTTRSVACWGQRFATEEVSPFANSSMDGYAVRADDTSGAPVRLTVIASTMAGRPFEQTVGPGKAARIMTGEPMPAGADAVSRATQCRPW